MNEQFGVIF